MHSPPTTSTSSHAGPSKLCVLCCCRRRFWHRSREGGRALNLGLEITVLSRVSTATATARQTTAAWDEVDVLGGGATPPRVLKFNIVIDPKAYKKWHRRRAEALELTSIGTSSENIRQLSGSEGAARPLHQGPFNFSSCQSVARCSKKSHRAKKTRKGELSDPAVGINICSSQG